MLHIVCGGVGAGKSTLLMQTLTRDLERGKTIRTLVPEQFAFTYDKNLYAMLGAKAFNRVKTGSFRSLTAEILSEIACAPRDAADDVIKTVVLHRVLQSLSDSHALRYYGGQADQPAFFAELQKQLAELMQSGSTPELLADAASRMQGALPEKILDIARIFADYLDELERLGMRDALCDTVTAAAAADGSQMFRGSAVYLDEFESFTGDQYILLEVLLRDCDDVWIALRTDNPDAPDYSRFDAVNLTCRRFRRLAQELNVPCEVQVPDGLPRFHDASLAHLGKYILTPQMPPYEGTSAVTVCEARDMTLEVEYTAAMIRRLLMQGEVSCRDILVVPHDLSAYGAQLEAAFGRYEIPFFMDLHRSVLHTAVMKLPLSLLTLCCRTTTEQLLLFLKTQLSPLSPENAARLENYAFIWDIENEQWEQPFAAETDPDGEAEALRAADDLEDLRLQVHAAVELHRAERDVAREVGGDARDPVAQLLRERRPDVERVALRVEGRVLGIERAVDHRIDRDRADVDAHLLRRMDICFAHIVDDDRRTQPFLIDQTVILCQQRAGQVNTFAADELQSGPFRYLLGDLAAGVPVAFFFLKNEEGFVKIVETEPVFASLLDPVDLLAECAVIDAVEIKAPD